MINPSKMSLGWLRMEVSSVQNRVSSIEKQVKEIAVDINSLHDIILDLVDRLDEVEGVIM